MEIIPVVDDGRDYTQIDELAWLLAASLLLCTTTEPIDRLARRLGLQLDPITAQLSPGTGAAIEMTKSGSAFAFFGPQEDADTLVFAWEHSIWSELIEDLRILGIRNPSFEATAADFPE